MALKQRRGAKGARGEVPPPASSKAAARGAVQGLGLWGAAVPLAAAAVYLNTLQGALFFDDESAVVLNKDVTGGAPLTELLTNDFWGVPMSSWKSHKSYRPLTVLSFRLNHLLGGLDPWGYHAGNVLLHAATSFSFLLLCRAWCNPRAGGGVWGDEGEELTLKWVIIPNVAAMLFALHPVHVDAVASVVGRAELLCGLLVTLSLLAWHRGRAAAALALAVLAMLSKEMGFAALPVIIVWEASSAALAAAPRRGAHAARALAVAGVAAVVGGLRVWANQGGFPTWGWVDNPTVDQGSRLVRAMTYMHLHAVNLWLLIFPARLCPDYSWPSVPEVESPFDPRNIFTACAYAAVLAGTCLAAAPLFRRRPDGSGGSGAAPPPALMALALGVASFVPSSNIFFPVGFVVAERVLYTPSMGFCLLAAQGGVAAARAARRAGRVPCGAGAAALVTVLAMYGARTWSHNPAWSGPETLWRAALHVAPDNIKMLHNLASALSDSGGRLDEAEAAVRRSMSLRPAQREVDRDALLTLGIILMKRGEAAEAARVEAEATYQAALALPNVREDTRYYAKLRYNYGISLLYTQPRLARESFLVAIEFNGEYAQAFNNLGAACVHMAQAPHPGEDPVASLEQAAEAFAWAAELDPGFRDPRVNLEAVSGHVDVVAAGARARARWG